MVRTPSPGACLGPLTLENFAKWVTHPLDWDSVPVTKAVTVTMKVWLRLLESEMAL